MAGKTTNGTAPCKKVKWLQRLLDDGEDSSDTTPQLQEQKQVPEKSKSAETRLKKRKAHKAKSKSKHVAVEKRPQHSKTSTTSLTDTKDGDRENRRPRKPEEKTQRKRPHTELGILVQERDDAKEKTAGLQSNDPIDPAKARAAAFRRRRMKKLHARRKATGEHARLAAVKLKRHESSEALRLKRNQREQMRKKVPVAAGTGEEIKGQGKARARPAPLFANEAKERKRMLQQQRLAAIKAKKQLGGLNSPSALTMKRPRPADSDKERRQQRLGEVLHALGADVKDHAELAKKRQKLGHLQEVRESSTGNGISHVESPSKMSESRAAGKQGMEKAAVSEAQHEHDAVDAKLSGDSSNVDGPESQQEYQESCQDTIVKADVKEEGQVESPALSNSLPEESVNPQDKDDKTISNEKKGMLLDMATIPRKFTRDGPAGTSAAPFVIPKRSSTNTNGQVEAPGVAQGIPAGPRSDHKPLEAHTPVAVKPLSSPEPRSQLSNRDPIRSQQERTKNSVPVKKTMLSAHDKALMRLARKRNSIFLAAAELAAQPSPVDNKVSATRMTGYDVYDADGKVLPDLVSRLSCATKREMAANKDSFAASFFGVSLVAPKAKGNAGSSVDECAGVEGRKMNCYEELHFERPEDREFYQRRMYSTTFVPQHLRGRATLIIRTARFERKSTGIRFNQDRDREEFAGSLSKRYTFKKSVPRCEIPRENWQKIMRNQRGVVYLHYNNLENAERASYLFRDDDGNPLELKREQKTRVGSSRGSSPANRAGRSCSSDRSPPKSSPQSSQGGSVRNTPHWQRDRQRATSRYSRYDRPPSSQRNGEEDRYGLSVGGRRSRSRSRSRSRPRRLPDPYYDFAAKGSVSETANEAKVVPSNTLLSSEWHKQGLVSTHDALANGKSIDNRESQDSNSTSKGDRDGDVEENALDYATIPNAPSSPRTTTQDRGPCEKDLESGEEQEEGEIESNIVPAPETTDRSNDSGGGQRSRSPPSNWRQPNDLQPRRRQEDYRGRSYEQQYNCGNRRRSRSRSRSRPEGFAPWDRDDGWDSSYAKDRRSREYGPADDYDNGRRMYSGEMDRYRGRDYRSGGYNDPRGNVYSRPY